MAHQSLYRRYRPRRFGELVGQEHVVRALRNAVREDRVGHAYLFSGPRGTGKTTSARVLAKVLNCEQPVDGEPCCVCASCLAVEAGTSFDVHELDAASNNGVDAMRDLIERAMLGTSGRRKVYILDEVHMLSKAAEAALLKTLEEPPEHVVFVLATTDPQRVSPTIRSRTQHLEFHLLPMDALEAHVRWVVADAGLPVDDAAIDAVLGQGGGSARDTLSALDQVVAAGGVAPGGHPLDELVESLIDQDAGRALAALAAAVRAGRDPRTLAEHTIAHLRDAFLSLMAPELVALPDRRAAVVSDQATRLGPGTIVRAMEVLGDTLVELRHAPDPRVLVEVALVRLTTPAADPTPAGVLARLEALERAVGAARPADAPPPLVHDPTSPIPRPDPTGAHVRPASAPGAATPASTAATPAPARPAPASPAPDAPAPPARPGGGRARLGSAVGGPGADPTAPQRRPDVAPEPGEPAAPPATPAAGPATPAARPATPAAGPATPAARPATPAARPEGAGLGAAAAWERVKSRLKGLTKAVYSAVQVADSDHDRLVLSVPNAPHQARCENERAAVEALLAEAAGHPVRLVFRVAEEAAAPPPDEAIDPDELVDAPRRGTDPLSRLTQAFPGAELVDEG